MSVAVCGAVRAGKEEITTPGVEINRETLRWCADSDRSLPEFTILVICER